MKATLILANGSIFSGTSIGSTETRLCELVLNTSMAGYQEILTDPACAGQGVVMSYPLIGNYGVIPEDDQSRRPWAEALVVRHLSPRGSNFRCEGDLNTYLKEHNITGIQGVDTRALTKILRNQGSMNGMLTCAEHFNIAQVLEELKTHKPANSVAQVTRPQAEVFPAQEEERCRVALLDYGVTKGVIQCLTRRGCAVTALPASTSAQEVLSGGYDGVFLSDGPGDPADNAGLAAQVKELYASSLPLYAMGLGHQLLAIASGARTERLPYGHRGGNVPVRDLELGRVFITSQNHGYAVIRDSVDPAAARVSHENVNDNSCEGLNYTRPNCFSTQFHPEANTGPKAVEYVLDRFVEQMTGIPAPSKGGVPATKTLGGDR